MIEMSVVKLRLIRIDFETFVLPLCSSHYYPTGGASEDWIAKDTEEEERVMWINVLRCSTNVANWRSTWRQKSGSCYEGFNRMAGEWAGGPSLMLEQPRITPQVVIYLFYFCPWQFNAAPLSSSFRKFIHMEAVFGDAAEFTYYIHYLFGAFLTGVMAVGFGSLLTIF